MLELRVSLFAILAAFAAGTGCAKENARASALASAQPTAPEPVAPPPAPALVQPAAPQPTAAQPPASEEADERVYRGSGESWVKWLPELLKNKPKHPTWTTYNLGDHVTFRGPPGLWAKTYEMPRELRGDFGNRDFVASISYGVGVRGNVPAAQQYTTMGGLPAAIGKVPGFRDLWAQTIGRPRQPDVSVRVKFAIKRKWVSRSVAQEVVDLVRSIKMNR